MDFKITEQQKSQVELRVELTPEEFKPFIEKAVEHISEHSKIEGFRPGKASFEVVKNRVGEQNIYNQAAELAIQKHYVDIMSKEKQEVIGQPQIKLEKASADEGLIFTATVAKVPTVKLGDFSKVKVEKKEITVSDEEVEKVLEDLRKHRVTEVIEEKAVEQGDKVEIDFDVSRDNVPIENGSSKNYPLVIGEGQFIPGFEEELIGMKSGEEKTFNLKFPKDYHAQQLAGKEHQFKVKLHSVYSRTLPELNDDFATGFGFEKLEKLKEQIKENIIQEQKQKEEQRVEIEMLQQLIKISEFGEIPDVLVNSEVNKMLSELQQQVGQQGLKFEDYLKQLGKSLDQMKLDLAPQALERVKSALLTRAVFFQENMKITPEEVDAELNKIKEQYGQMPQLQEQINSPEYRDYVENVLGNRKVIDFLREQILK